MHATRTTLVELGSHHSTDVGRDLFAAPGAPNMSQRNDYLLHRSQAYCQLGRENNLLGYLGTPQPALCVKCSRICLLALNIYILRMKAGCISSIPTFNNVFRQLYFRCYFLSQNSLFYFVVNFII